MLPILNNIYFQKGDYVCDSSFDIPEEHEGAWDNPSADVLKGAEEDIVFTHLQASSNLSFF